MADLKPPKSKHGNSLELAGAGRGGGESDGGQESGQPQGQTHLTAQAHRHGKTARTQGWGLLALLDYHGAHRCSRAGVTPAVLCGSQIPSGGGQFMTTPGAAFKALN